MNAFSSIFLLSSCFSFTASFLYSLCLPAPSLTPLSLGISFPLLVFCRRPRMHNGRELWLISVPSQSSTIWPRLSLCFMRTTHGWEANRVGWGGYPLFLLLPILERNFQILITCRIQRCLIRKHSMSQRGTWRFLLEQKVFGDVELISINIHEPER